MEENSNTLQHWFAVYTLPRSERKVLERILEAGVQAYLPLITTVRIWSDRKKKVTTPLIPSYVFVRIEELKLNDVLKIQGVTGVLKYLKKPAKIQEFEIETLKILLKDSDNICLLDEGAAMLPGDKIMVKKGAFKGLIGECCQVNGKHRIIVVIHAVNHFFEVNVPMSFIEKI